MPITQSELIEEIRAVLARSPHPDAAMTTAEIAEIFGLSVETMRKRLKPVVTAGRLRPVKAWRPTIDGRMQPVPAWELAG